MREYADAVRPRYRAAGRRAQREMLNTGTPHLSPAAQSYGEPGERAGGLATADSERKGELRVVSPEFPPRNPPSFEAMWLRSNKT